MLDQLQMPSGELRLHLSERRVDLRGEKPPRIFPSLALVGERLTQDIAPRVKQIVGCCA
jgi:hypothetical protein